MFKREEQRGITLVWHALKTGRLYARLNRHLGCSHDVCHLALVTLSQRSSGTRSKATAEPSVVLEIAFQLNFSDAASATNRQCAGRGSIASLFYRCSW